MGLRPFKLPHDLSVLRELLPPSFQYPENPSWSLQDDDVQQLVEMYGSIRRMWPLLNLAQLIVPSLRDVMRGFVWEEDGQPVGMVNILRDGMTDKWIIANVAVLPDYRRRGIARQLIEATLEYARGRDAATITLDVIDGNLPAFKLYEMLGFEHFSGSHELVCESDPPEAMPLPDGYRLTPGSMFDWRTAYDLAQRITPPHVTRYLPVEAGRYRQPAIARLLFPVFIHTMGFKPHVFAITPESGGLVVGTARADVRKRSGGTNRLMIKLDPAHDALALPVLSTLLHIAATHAPGRRIEISIEDWQTALCDAAGQLGLTPRYHYLTMGWRV